MYIISSELYHNFLEIYYDEYNELSDTKKRKAGDNYDPESFLKGYNYIVWSENKEEPADKEESADTSGMPKPRR